jgi:hypothetical protein
MEIHVICTVFNDAVRNLGFMAFQQQKLYVTTGIKYNRRFGKYFAHWGRVFHFANIHQENSPKQFFHGFTLFLQENIETVP